MAWTGGGRGPQAGCLSHVSPPRSRTGPILPLPSAQTAGTDGDALHLGEVAAVGGVVVELQAGKAPPPKGAGVPDGLVPQRHGSQARRVGKTVCLSGRRRVQTGSARTQKLSARAQNRPSWARNEPAARQPRSAERRINRRGAESLVLGPVFMPGGYQRRLRRGRQPKTFGIRRLPARPPAPRIRRVRSGHGKARGLGGGGKPRPFSADAPRPP